MNRTNIPSAGILGAIAVLAVAVGWMVVAPDASAQSSSAWSSFVANCASFERATIIGSWGGLGSDSLALAASIRDTRFQLRLKHDGDYAVDMGWPVRYRVMWDGNSLTRAEDRLKPGPLPDLDIGIVDIIFDECRAGFTSTAKSQVVPEVDGHDLGHPAQEWWLLDLPGDWDDRIDLFLALRKGSGKPTSVAAVFNPGSARIVQLDGVNWSANWPDEALIWGSPPYMPARPQAWTGPLDRMSVHDGLEKYSNTTRNPLDPD